MTQAAIPYLLMRGGTSRGSYLNRADLPEDLDTLAKVLIAMELIDFREGETTINIRAVNTEAHVIVHLQTPGGHVHYGNDAQIDATCTVVAMPMVIARPGIRRGHNCDVLLYAVENPSHHGRVRCAMLGLVRINARHRGRWVGRDPERSACNTDAKTCIRADRGGGGLRPNRHGDRDQNRRSHSQRAHWRRVRCSFRPKYGRLRSSVP
ncbi:hypothetical protein [Tateyamaria sp.]|uniref:hypothetical protein n=1 Tax=Tateyamaria sp. TaxID=1929288 RepID=UPI0039B8661B